MRAVPDTTSTGTSISGNQSSAFAFVWSIDHWLSHERSVETRLMPAGR